MSQREEGSARPSAMRERDVSLLELLDRILDKGVVIAGDVVISVADIDLIYLGVKIILTSVDNLDKHRAQNNLRLGMTVAPEVQAKQMTPIKQGSHDDAGN